MSNSNPSSQFMDVSSCKSKRVADFFLLRSSNKVEESVLQFMEAKSTATKLFAKLLDNKEEIKEDNFSELFSLIDLDPAEPVSLRFLFEFKVSTPGIFTLPELAAGVLSLNLKAKSTFDDIRTAVATFRIELSDAAKMRETFQYVFGISLEEGQRTMNNALCIDYFKMLLGPLSPMGAAVGEWAETHVKKAITRDSWFMMFDFVMKIKSDLSNFTDDDCWPVIVEDFVEWYKKRLAAQ